MGATSRLLLAMIFVQAGFARHSWDGIWSWNMRSYRSAGGGVRLSISNDVVYAGR